MRCKTHNCDNKANPETGHCHFHYGLIKPAGELNAVELEDLLVELEDAAVCSYGDNPAQNAAAKARAEKTKKLIRLHVSEAQVRREIEVHNRYWHSQRHVSENGIGPVALARRDASQKQLTRLMEMKKGFKSEQV